MLRFRRADWTYAAGTTEPKAAPPETEPERWPDSLRGSDFPLEPRRPACVSFGDEARLSVRVPDAAFELKLELWL